MVTIKKAVTNKKSQSPSPIVSFSWRSKRLTEIKKLEIHSHSCRVEKKSILLLAFSNEKLSESYNSLNVFSLHSPYRNLSLSLSFIN